MQDRFRSFLQIIETFNKEGVEYIVVGGVAVNLHGFPRNTEDIDMFIRIDPDNVERLRKALKSIYDDEAIEEITLEELEEYSVLRYGTPDGFYIDLIARLGEFAAFEDVQAEEMEVRGVKVRVATAQSLHWMKKDTLRLKDRQDAQFLLEILGEGDDER